MKSLLKKIIKIIATLGAPITLLAAAWLKFIKRAGTGKINDRIFMQLGILPVLDHYYQPLINPRKHLRKPLREDRLLKGIDYNMEEQLSLLSKFSYREELLKFPMHKTGNTEYYYKNESYESGDSEYLYNIIRHYKPANMIEIGSGYSTLMARNAMEKNKAEDAAYACRHICIEPYQQPWLEQLNIELIRERVECIDPNIFQALGKNDILFIDSSHIIRPQGDVLFEFLELLPTLKPGVLVHVHDIFTPKDYLDNWVLEEHRLWNEQYLLEAFLTFNKEFRIIGAVNLLAHRHHKALADKCPVFEKEPGREPGAFWMVRN